MASSYDVIRADNKRKYGTDVDRYGPVLLANLYSDRTHFVYELLQNAEDARATEVEFQLFSDRLELTHDGRLFDETDVRGICGLVEGTGRNDLNRIGKFGIGFKSVYAYTAAPEVHSGSEHFSIRHYVQPHPIPAKRIPRHKTLFVLPFNHLETTAQQAFQQIAERLGCLGCRTLLFLRNLKKITWSVQGGSRGSYLRKQEHDGEDRRVSLRGEGVNGKTDEEWLLFERPLNQPEAPNLKVEAAFLLALDDESGQDRVVRIEGPSHLVVFFPTERETHLGFLVQGPYRTTPARDNIPKDDGWNRLLIKETATLVAATLSDLCDRDLLTVSLLEAMPIRSHEFPPDDMFRPIFEAVREALRDQPLLPAHGEGGVAACYAKLARSTALRGLLSNQQLRKLFASTDPIQWLSDDISQDKTPDLRQYVMNELKVQEIDPEAFARRLTPAFVEEQTDNWMVRFYEFLAGQRALWGPHGVLRRVPFLRLESGKHVMPFLQDGSPRAYLPPADGGTGVATVKRSIAKDPKALGFLRALGLTEPDAVAEVLEHILPKYENEDAPSITVEENRRHVETILHALTVAGGRKDVLLDNLRRTPFLRAANAKTGRQKYAVPTAVWFPSETMKMLLKGNSNAWFLDGGYTGETRRFELLGVSDRPRLRCRPTDESNYVMIEDGWGRHMRGVNGFDPDCTVDGLEYAVRNPTTDRSQYVWNVLLVPNAKCIRGRVQVSNHATFTAPEERERWSKMGGIVRDNAWLPDGSGKFCKPGDLSLDDLPKAFQRDEVLAQQLGMKPSSLGSVAAEAGVPADALKTFIACYRKNGNALLALMERLGPDEPEGQGEKGDVNYEAAIVEAFERPGRRPESAAAEAPGAVPDPEGRRKRTAKEIEEGRAAEGPPEARFHRVSQKQWEKKNSEVRTFLGEQYGGGCQVCGESFTKRDGNPYFEGLYIVSHTRARWIDKPGNVLCLCPTCCAKFLHGAVEAEDILGQINKIRVKREGGTTAPALAVTLCGERTRVRFTEKHILELQALLTAAVGE
jgi:hypothetical protein